MYQFSDQGSILLIILFLWTLPWKIYSLWLAAKHNQRGWFFVLLVLNTAGILEIFYIFYIAKKKWNEVKKAFLGVLSSKTKK